MTKCLRLSGTVEMFTDGIPDAVFMNMEQAQCALFAWVDKERHQSAGVVFDQNPSSTSSNPETGISAQQGNRGRGRYTMSLDVTGAPVSELLKLQGVMRMRDTESGTRRTVTVATGGLDMRLLMQGQDCTVKLSDTFNPGNYIQVTMRATNAADYSLDDGTGQSLAQQGQTRIQLRATHLRGLQECNREMKRISQSIQAGMKENGIEMPPGGKMFADGLSCFEWAGAVLSDGTQIEPFTTHYAVLGQQEQMWNRHIPVGLVVYSLYLRLSHTGLTMPQILAMPLERRCTLFLTGLGMSFDAGLVPYVRDFTTGLMMSMIQGFGIGQKTTENIALPCSAPQFLGRHVRVPNPIVPPHGASIDALAQLLAGREENLRYALADDCESSSGLSMIALTSLVEAYQQTPDLKTLCKGYENLFKAWSRQDWESMGRFVGEMVSHVHGGALTLSTVTGLASNASASEVGSGASYNGHCHNVGRLNLPDRPVHCFIVEGTAPMESCTVHRDSPTVMCQVTEMVNGHPQKVSRPLHMPDFLTRLGKTVAFLTQIISRPYGMQVAEGQGWPLKEPASGWLSSTIFSNALDSDPSFPLNFYNRAMYTSWQCTSGGVGCLPVQEAHARIAGCHPYDLNKVDLRALSVALPQDIEKTMKAIIDEANPPLASESQFQQLARTWSPAASLGRMNQDAQAELEHGVRYHTVSCMESPGSQDYTPIILGMKAILACEWNRLNRAHPKSDGGLVSVEELGTGVTIKIRVPDRPIEQLTLIETCVQAMRNVGWKGRIPDV